MRTVDIAELQNRLSSYITRADAGEEILIQDCDRPVARLIPLATDGLDDDELELVATGQMTLPKEPWDPEAFFKLPIAQLAPGSAPNAGTQAIIDEREEGW